MISTDLLPSAPLRDYIHHYRLRHFVYQNGLLPTIKPFPPRPEQCLTFYVRGSETSRYLLDGVEIKKPRSVVSGQFTERVDRCVSYPEILMIIVDFRPGVLHRLTGIPFSELRNKDLDAESVFPAGIKRVNERLSSSCSYCEMIHIVDSFLTGLVLQFKKEFLPIDKLLTLVTIDPDHSIDWLASNACFSARQLERKFDERIGVGPKTFLRIARFNQSYSLHLTNPKLNWYQIAIACGYTDYQHMVKEYQQFALANPINFFEEERLAPGRILGLTK